MTRADLSEEKKGIKRLVDVFDKNIDQYKKESTKYNEQMTRQQYIDVLLKYLGWDISNPNGLSYNDREVVAEEYSYGSRCDRPDYTIRMNGISKFFIEAKKVSVDVLNLPSPAIQCRRYGWNAGHDISILTNFEYLIIYLTHDAPQDTDSSSVSRYKVYHYKNYVDKFDEIYSLISRDSVAKGYYDKWVQEKRPEDYSKTALDNVFLNQLNNWRVLIAEDRIQKDNNIDINSLNDSIQLFLNQIIFLRFAEDNRFEKEDSLKKEILQHDSYKIYFADLDKKYNSELFKDSTLIDKISDDLLKDIVDKLYFPNTSYDFSVIDLSILSKIYENFLQFEIVVKNNKVKLEKTKSAKIKAVVSTPKNIVVSMIQKALKNIVNGKTPKEILQLKIADLSVGSGIFLIEAYNYIENYLIDYFSKKKGQYPSTDLVPFSLKRKIIENVLYGFDINNQAVKLTRFSLLLRLLSNEKLESVHEISPILPNLKKTIVNGNSLISDNDLDITELDLSEVFEISPLNTQQFKFEKFDCIIGNPPYLKKEDIIESTPKTEINIYEKNYVSADKQYDKYFLFIEKALELIKPDGAIVLLVPNKLFTVGSAQKLREILYKSGFVYRIYDFGVSQIFKDVINYVCILNLKKNNGYFKYIKVNDASEVYKDQQGLDYSNEDLNHSHWFLTSDEMLKKYFENAMTHFPCMDEVVIPSNGIQTSKSKIYEIDKQSIINESEDTVTFVYNNKQFTIEKSILRNFYKPAIGSSVKKSYEKIDANKYVIFPYREGKVIKEAVLKKEFPLTWEYFNYNKNELLPKILGGKRDVKGSTLDNIVWYQYGRTQGLNVADKDKIIVGVLSKNPIFNIDRNGMLYASGGTAGYIGLFLKDNSKYTLEYLQAWLSHDFTDKIFKTLGSNFEGGYYTHGTGIYKNIPLLPIDFDNDKELSVFQSINELVDKVNELVDKVNELNKKNNFEKDNSKLVLMERVKEKTIEKINNQIDVLLNMKMEQINECKKKTEH